VYLNRNLNPTSSASESEPSRKQAEIGSTLRQAELSLRHASGSFWLCLLLELDAGGDVFLGNIGLSPHYTEIKVKDKVDPVLN
jgi:hypothetical protein